MTTLYKFPKAAKFGKVLAKSKIYERATPSTKVKELFVTEVERMVWAYKLSPATINLPATDDVQEIQFKKIDENSYLFDGKTQLNDVCRVVKISTDTFDDAKGDADTVAGLILEITGSLPKSGDSINYRNYTFKIITVNNIRIVRVQLTINDVIEEET